METHSEYWQRRADEERSVADACADSHIAAIHRRLAIYQATVVLDSWAMPASYATPIID